MSVSVGGLRAESSLANVDMPGRTRLRTSSKSGYRGEETGVECVSIVVDASYVNVEHPARLFWVDAQ